MKQLVQLQEKLSESIQAHHAQVLVIFREESEGQEGLKKVVEQTKTPFTLALDTDAQETSVYSPGARVHDSYLVDTSGMICSILKGTRYDRAQADEFAEALDQCEVSGSRRAEPARSAGR